MSEFTCVEEGCNRPVQVKREQLCGMHYQRRWKEGTHNPEVRWTAPNGIREKCFQLDCHNPVKARGLCSKHYQASRAGKKPPRGFRQTKWVNEDGTRKKCSEEGCEKEVFVKGVCSAHYHAGWRVGTSREKKPVVYCPTPGCGRVRAYRKTLCAKCYQDRWRYGLSEETWLEMCKPENKKCSNASCGSTENLHIDHDHSCDCQGTFEAKSRVACGKCVRGWLCRSCNLGLGSFNDSPDKLRGILQYLERWKEQTSN